MRRAICYKERNFEPEYNTKNLNYPNKYETIILFMVFNKPIKQKDILTSCLSGTYSNGKNMLYKLANFVFCKFNVAFVI